MTVSLTSDEVADLVRRSPCIETTNGRHPRGYGQCKVYRFGRRISLTHVLAWVDHHGRLPGPGMKILHHCDNPPCQNTDHLYEGSQADNMRDALVRGRHYGDFLRNRTHCPNGHEYSDVNTYRRPDGGRACRECRRHYCKKYRDRNKPPPA